jgi:hypothetical protein
MTTALEPVIIDDYDSLKEDIDSIITEAVFNSREDLIKGYWEVGQRIRVFTKGNVTKLLQDLALDINKSERTLWYAVQFYDKYPEYHKINELEEGKNLSWNRIIKKYITTPKEEPMECHHNPIVICKICRKTLKDYHANRNI